MKTLVAVLMLLCSGTPLRAQTESGTVLRWEVKTYSQSAHITRNQVVYSVKVGGVVYQIAHRSDKVEMSVGEQLKCRVEKDHFFVLDKKGKERKYDIVGTEQADPGGAK